MVIHLKSFFAGAIVGGATYYFSFKEPLERRNLILRTEILRIHKQIPGARNLPQVGLGFVAVPVAVVVSVTIIYTCINNIYYYFMGRLNI
jgi:hypothetical protein